MLGLAAQFEFSAFVRLAATAGRAPDVPQRTTIAHAAAAALDRHDRLAARVVELDGDPAEVGQPFASLFDDFEERTVPSDWHEQLLKAYIGYSVADDFSGYLARGADEQTRALVEQVLAEQSHVAYAHGELSRLIEEDPTRASRMALWGRRLVGELLSVLGELMRQHPGLARLVTAPAGDGGEPATEPTPATVFSHLTAEHTRRMERLGLTP